MSALAELAWLWIPVTVFAAFAQTLRNAAQRHLTGDLGTLGATLVRFLYGVPFAALWLGALYIFFAVPLPAPNAKFILWVAVGAVGQVIATALLLRTMAERNFAVGVAYSKTEIIQVALFSIVLLGEPVSPGTGVAILLGTLGVLLLSPVKRAAAEGAPGRLDRWLTPAALFGLGSGAAFAVAAVGYRAAALALGEGSAFMAAAYALVWAQILQSILLGGWLWARKPAAVAAVIRAWRVSLLAGLAGAVASLAWFTAFTLEPVANVRTLGLVEILFSYGVSLRFLRERSSAREAVGILLLVLGVVLIVQRF